jgi:protein-tyrosine phosphatase
MLFSKKRQLADLMEGFYDIHCHLLPAVDDGSPDAEYSTLMMEEFEKLGMKGLYLTPHIINGMYDNRDEEALRSEFSKFKYDGKMDVRLAAEYFIGDKFAKRITSGQSLAMSGGHILCEFEMNSYSMNSFNQLFDISLAGYTVIIAHPERYSFIQHDHKGELFDTLSNSSYKFQLNLLSLIGFHGLGAMKLSRRLLEEGRYDFVGTDAHSLAYLQAIRRHKVSEKLFRQLEKLRENNKTLF